MGTNETTIYTALLIAASVIGIILIFFIISLFAQHRRNLQLHREKIQAEIATLEKERKRLASDLHDEIGPGLSAIKLHVNTLDLSAPEDLQVVANTGKYIDEMLVRVREIANDLLPSLLERKGLDAAISDFASRMNQSSQIQIRLSMAEGSVLANKQREIHLFRIVQEIIHNAIKHARASVIQLNLNKKNTLLTLEISDNGCGFDYRKITKESEGLGLKNILSRVELLGGAMYLDSNPGKGTHYSIEIPAT